jgi:hypothetical protein
MTNAEKRRKDFEEFMAELYATPEEQEAKELEGITITRTENSIIASAGGHSESRLGDMFKALQKYQDE